MTSFHVKRSKPATQPTEFSSLPGPSAESQQPTAGAEGTSTVESLQEPTQPQADMPILQDLAMLSEEMPSVKGGDEVSSEGLIYRIQVAQAQ